MKIGTLAVLKYQYWVYSSESAVSPRSYQFSQELQKHDLVMVIKLGIASNIIKILAFGGTGWIRTEPLEEQVEI